MSSRVSHIVSLMIIILVISVIFLGGGAWNNIKVIKNISDLDAQNIIDSEYLNQNSLEEYTQIKDSIYTIIEIPVKYNKATILTLMVKTEQPFHVFQNRILPKLLQLIPLSDVIEKNLLQRA